MSHLGAGTTTVVTGTHRFRYFQTPFTLPIEDDEDDKDAHLSVRRAILCDGGTQTDEYIHTQISEEGEEALRMEEKIRKGIQSEREKRRRERSEAEAALPPNSIEAFEKFLVENENKDFALREKELDDEMERNLAKIEEDLRKRYATNNKSNESKHLKQRKKRGGQHLSSSFRQRHSVAQVFGGPVETVQKGRSIAGETRRKQLLAGTNASIKRKKEHARCLGVISAIID